VQHVKQHQAAFAGMPDYMHRALLRAYLQITAFSPLSEEALEVYAASWLGETGQPAFYRQITQLDQKYTDEAQGLYRQMDCPVNVLWGERDEWIPVAKGQELAC